MRAFGRNITHPADGASVLKLLTQLSTLRRNRSLRHEVHALLTSTRVEGVPRLGKVVDIAY